jgi:hypothetical protein
MVMYRMDANIAFMRGGGYSISQRLPNMQKPVSGSVACAEGGRWRRAPLLRHSLL